METLTNPVFVFCGVTSVTLFCMARFTQNQYIGWRTLGYVATVIWLTPCVDLILQRLIAL